MNEIPSAKLSPRIENGKMYWYYLDTFPLELTINLTDGHTQEPIEFAPTDEIIISFFKEISDCKYDHPQEKLIYSQTFTNIQNNKISMRFDEELSAKFLPGKYRYFIKYNYTDIRTIGASCEIEVEECH